MIRGGLSSCEDEASKSRVSQRKFLPVQRRTGGGVFLLNDGINEFLILVGWLSCSSFRLAA